MPWILAEWYRDNSGNTQKRTVVVNTFNEQLAVLDREVAFFKRECTCKDCEQVFTVDERSVDVDNFSCVNCMHERLQDHDGSYLCIIGKDSIVKNEVLGGYWQKHKNNWVEPRIFINNRHGISGYLINNEREIAKYWNTQHLSKERYNACEIGETFKYRNTTFKKMSLEEAKTIVSGKFYKHILF